MRHKIAGRRLGLPTDQRMALLQESGDLAPVAWDTWSPPRRAPKRPKRLAEKLITLAREDTLHHRRTAQRFLLPRTGLIESKKGTLREAPGGGKNAGSPGAGSAPRRWRTR